MESLGIDLDLLGFKQAMSLRFLVDDYNEVVAEANRLRVERDRLADGIRFLVNTYDPYEAPDASMPVRELRLLDVATDDREDGQ